MRQALAKKLFAGSVIAIFALITMLPVATAYADTYPYLKVTNGDLSAGGWFGPDCYKATDPNFQDAYYSAGGITDNSAGGIYTYASNAGSYRGSSSQYAAYAQGIIDNGSAPNGFYSGSVNTVSVNNTLSFANVYNLPSPPMPAGYTSGIWGGSLHEAAQCIPDYFTVKQPSSTTALTSPLSASPASGAYTADGTGSNAFALNTSALTIAAGANISIFVNGNVYIGGNITYAAHDTTNIPRLAIVAKGDIFVDGNNVTNLDGLYIAQPDSSKFNDSTNAIVSDNTQGVFYSCHGQAAGQTIDSGFLIGNCQKPLVVNGAVIAKQVNLLRISGDISGAPAETFNYSSDMVLGGPFFPGSSSGGSSVTGTPVFDRIISLPPVF
jgi:hypothetical protein